MATSNQIFIAVLGAGGVGKCFLSQLRALAARRPSPKLTLCYLATSRKAVFHDNYADIGLDVSLEAALHALTGSTKPALPLAHVIEYLAAAPAPTRTVLVDNTSSEAVAEQYPRMLSRGISIVTPNKKAFSGSYGLWTAISDAVAASPSGARVYHESSVGAGLPVISTLRDLVDTGDRVAKIEGVFSGTMSFLFNSFAPAAADGRGGGRWSDEVKRAQQLGYTEPDPRDDLNGLDVARKLTILARLAGLPVESPTSFPVQSLIPAELAACASGDEFLDRLPAFDDQMEETRKAAERAGKVVRFVGSIDVAAGAVRVGLQEFDRSHPIAALKGSDNIISFYTERYGSNPLIVQGAGAGGEVTAMGVTADLIRVISHFN